jgi:7-carboxy-7-deazaguanine synthase
MSKKTLVINEIFHSIQGESLYAGCPCVFIRLTGCNLRCAYCDTSYAFSEGTEMDMDTLMNHIASFPCNMVEITGGEPLLQENTPFLVNRLLSAGYTVLMETNGSYDINIIDKRCIKIVDMKCPSSGESHRNLYEIGRAHV